MAFASQRRKSVVNPSMVEELSFLRKHRGFGSHFSGSFPNQFMFSIKQDRKWKLIFAGMLSNIHYRFVRIAMDQPKSDLFLFVRLLQALQFRSIFVRDRTVAPDKD